MKILGISASPRTGRMVHNAIQAVLKGCQDEYEIISLANKKINGCKGCTACAKDNMCKVEDDFILISQKMKDADIIIFGAPNYFGMINALGHACLERTFCFRHRGALSLKGKLGYIITTCETRETQDPVAQYIDKMFQYNAIKKMQAIQVNQYNQCYTCGYGHTCEAGIVVRKNGVLDKILDCHLPLEVERQQQTRLEILAMREHLKQQGVRFQ